MAEATTTKALTLTLRLNEHETCTIVHGLSLIDNFGDLDRADASRDLIAVIREAISE